MGLCFVPKGILVLCEGVVDDVIGVCQITMFVVI